jgi:hypothetical protein
MYYECKICDYNTSLRPSYQKHICSKKHISLCKASTDVNRTQGHPKAPKGTQVHPTSDNNIICQSADIPKPTSRIKRGKEIDLVSITSNMKYKLNSKVVLDNYKCEYCSSLLKSKRILVKHLIKSCKYIPVDFKNHLISIHNNNGNTKKKLDLIQSRDNIVSSNIVNNNNIQNNITINNNLDTRGLQEILPMLQEDMSHITRRDVLEIFSNPENFMLVLLSKVYSNPKNRNVYLNKRDNTITYLDAIQKRLTTKDKDKILKKLYNNFMGYMDDYLDDVKGELSSKIIRMMKSILDLHEVDDIG